MFERHHRHGRRHFLGSRDTLVSALRQGLYAVDPRSWSRTFRGEDSAALLRRNLIGLAVVAALSGFAGWQAWRIVDSDFTVLEADLLVDRWTGEDRTWSTRNWLRAHDAYAQALQITPDNPDLHDRLGLLYLMAARESVDRPAQHRRLFEVAAAHQLASLRLRPFHGVGWAALAESMQVISPGSPETWQAWRSARRYGALEFPVQAALARVGLMGWRDAPEDVRLWLRNTYLVDGIPRSWLDEMAEEFGVPEWRGEDMRPTATVADSRAR